MSLFVPVKTDGETLQYDDMRNAQSNALNSLLYWFFHKKGCGSTLQKDLVIDKFSTNNVTGSQNMLYVTGGSYQCIDYSSRFAVLIECGSLTTSNLSINDCTCYKQATGSYIIYGPSGPTLGSSRARVMKTLFYGTNATDARIKNNYVGDITGLKVFNNHFDDAGRRAYLGSVYATANCTGNLRSHIISMFGSFEQPPGSVHSWSYVTGNSAQSGMYGISYWENPDGTVLNQAGTGATSDETGLDMSADIKVNPGSCELRSFLNHHDPMTCYTTSAEARMYLLTTGSMLFNFITTDVNGVATYGSGLIDFQTDHQVPVFGSITTSDIHTGSCYVITKTWNDIAGSVDSIIGSFLGSLSSDTVPVYQVSVDNGGSWTNIDNGILGSINSITNTGSLSFKIQLNRVGSTQTDYINGYGAFYG